MHYLAILLHLGYDVNVRCAFYPAASVAYCECIINDLRRLLRSAKPYWRESLFFLAMLVTRVGTMVGTSPGLAWTMVPALAVAGILIAAPITYPRDPAR